VDARGRAAHERDLERHFDVAAGQLAQERISLPSAITSLPLRTVRRKAALTRDLDAVGEPADLESGAVGRADDEAGVSIGGAGMGLPSGRWPRPCRPGTHADPRRERRERAQVEVCVERTNRPNWPAPVISKV
jgi:hypothetical protein